MPFREQHSCMVDETATEIVEIRTNTTKWGEIKIVMARKAPGLDPVVRSLRIPGTVSVSVAQQLCTSRGGQFSPATPLNPQTQLLSDEYAFVKLNKKNKIEVLNALVQDFEMPFKEVGLSMVREYQNSLPDSAFAIILPGGMQDETGRTVPRTLRKLPYKTERGTVDKIGLQDGIAKVNHIRCSAGLKFKGLTLLLKAARTVDMDVQERAKFKLIDLSYYLENLERLGG